MITIKQIESPVVVTDGVTDVNLYAGQTYTCEVPVVNEWFEMEIDTRISGDSPSDSFQIPTRYGNILIEWGDGVVEYISQINQTTDPRLLHQYATEGIYNIKIKGDVQWRTTSIGERNKIIGISNFGTLIFRDVSNWFWDCNNLVLTATDSPNSAIDNLSSVFFGCQNLTNMPNFNGCYIKSMTSTFEGVVIGNLGSYDLRNCLGMTNFARYSAWSTDNYNASLMGFLRMQAGDTAPPTGWILRSNVPFHGGSAIATGDGLVARNYLINVLNWTITDSTP